ncbi:hypothetical protein LINPERHAP1_LOCUS11603 [Linum perenne]
MATWPGTVPAEAAVVEEGTLEVVVAAATTVEEVGISPGSARMLLVAVDLVD